VLEGDHWAFNHQTCTFGQLRVFRQLKHIFGSIRARTIFELKLVLELESNLLIIIKRETDEQLLGVTASLILARLQAIEPCFVEQVVGSR